MEVLELKSTVTKIKNSLEGLNSRFELAGRKTCQLKRLIQIMQTEEHNEKKNEKKWTQPQSNKEQSPSTIIIRWKDFLEWGTRQRPPFPARSKWRSTINCTNICIMGVAEREEREEKKFKEIIVENFQNLLRNKNLHI